MFVKYGSRFGDVSRIELLSHWSFLKESEETGMTHEISDLTRICLHDLQKHFKFSLMKNDDYILVQVAALVVCSEPLYWISLPVIVKDGWGSLIE